MTHRYLFEFEKNDSLTSKEHFYHFLWGYILPGINSILEIESNNDQRNDRKQYIFRCCGPIMNKIIEEIALLLDRDIDILPQGADLRCGTITVTVPRWDVMISKFTQDTLNDYFVDIRRFDQGTFEAIKNVREHMINKINKARLSDFPVKLEGRYIVLKRSDQPKYYDVGGGAEKSGYGTGRRALRDIQTAVRTLKNSGIRIGIFEAGRYNLASQIKTFGAVRGVIGITGAEFANILWMKPGTKVVQIIAKKDRRSKFLTRGLSVLCGLEYYQIESTKFPYPPLDAERLKTILR